MPSKTSVQSLRILQILLTALIFVFLAFPQFSTALEEELIENDEAQSSQLETDRESRLLGIPGFIPFGEFYNQGGKTCTIMGTGQTGACYSKASCRRLGGTVSDSTCGSGFKGYTCCLFNAICVSSSSAITVRRDNTYLMYSPATGGGLNCQTEFKFPKVDKNTCQLKLEFKNFRLGKPSMNGTTSGNCDRDLMKIRSANFRASICGIYEGNPIPDTEHLYLHYGDLNEISISMAVLDELQTSNVSILVKQIKCNDPNRAPQDCTQYFTKGQANIKSFNFDENRDNKGQQLNSLNYAVCIKSETQDASLSWSTCTDNLVADFDITRAGINDTNPNCVKDSVTIPGSPLGKYCRSEQMVGVIRSEAKPYIMYVDFDEVEFTDESCVPTPCNPSDPSDGQMCCPPPTPDPPGNRGFCLHYIKT